MIFFRELKKLSEDSLTKQPEEVFDILCKLGEGSYGSVFKALHKESKQVLAIKQVSFVHISSKYIEFLLRIVQNKVLTN